MRQRGKGMLGWVRGTPKWEGGPVQRLEWGCWCIWQEVESPSEGIMMALGAVRGDREKTT